MKEHIERSGEERRKVVDSRWLYPRSRRKLRRPPRRKEDRINRCGDADPFGDVCFGPLGLSD